jgi:hypothetical protein
MLCNTALQGRSTARLQVLHCQKYLTETPNPSWCPNATRVVAAASVRFDLRALSRADNRCSTALVQPNTYAQEVTAVPIQVCVGGACVRFGFHWVCLTNIVLGGQICMKNCRDDVHENRTKCLFVSLVVGYRLTGNRRRFSLTSQRTPDIRVTSDHASRIKVYIFLSRFCHFSLFVHLALWHESGHLL